MRAIFMPLALVGLIGCGSSKTDDATFLIKTNGQLVSGNKPAAGAVLLFHMVGEGSGRIPPRARVGPDGRFTVMSAGGDDGLPAGEYIVTVEWRSGSGDNGNDGRNLVAERYTNTTTSPLKASIRPDPDGNCTLPTFTLTNSSGGK